jgi:hypothetical protein
LSEVRIDKVALPKVIKTKEGFLKGEAIVTRTGVFKYKNADGTIRLELRHPDDVLLVESLDTLKSIPITNDHPATLVNSDNVADLMVGMTGDTVKVDDQHIISTISITHKDGINSINRGKQELSLGYSVNVIPEIGIYNGDEYTHRQSDIVYNHLAIVEVARAGRSARVNLDGAFVQCNNLINKEGLIMGIDELKELNSRLDEVETKMAKSKENNKKKDDKGLGDKDGDNKEEDDEGDKENSKMNKNKKDMQDKLDKAEAIIDQLKVENSQLKSVNNDATIAERVKHRMQLLTRANKVVNIDSLISNSDREIMETVIKAKDSGVNLDGKSDAYIEGRFDSIIDATPDSDAIKRQMLNISNSRVDSLNNITYLDKLKSHLNKKGI